MILRLKSHRFDFTAPIYLALLDQFSNKTTLRNILLVAAIVVIALVVFAVRLVLLALASVAYVYLLPGVIATKRNHSRQKAIYIVAALSGWLVLPWFGALWYATRGAVAASCVLTRR